MTNNTALYVLRFVWMLLFLLVLTKACESKAAVCKTAVNGVGVIVGKGDTKADAFGDASFQCFDRFMTEFRLLHENSRPDDDTMLFYIDVCANIKCAK
jgi:hypothetical protein